MKYKAIIEEILEVYNLNASDFAQKIDVQRSSISHILSGRNKPSLDLLIKVKKSFPELRWDYILLGEKPMTTTEKELVNKAQQNFEKELFQLDTSSSPTSSNKKQKLQEQEKDASATKDETQAIKEVVKIVWFYDDNTFQEFKPSH